jgi:precorrin-6B methylase 2
MIRTQRHLGFLFFIIFSLSACAQENPYTYKKDDPNGIGKWYKGREIAHVMGYQGMFWLERPERELEERTSLLLKNMNIQAQDQIADIGAGSGYHVFRMAKKAKNGMIYAVDIQDEMLAVLEQKKKTGNHTNVSVVKGSVKSINIPKNTLDKVLIVDVYHEMDYPVEMMQSVYSSMKPNGKLFLIEYRGEDPEVPIKRLHKMSEEQAVKELKAVGFTLEENISNLPWQHCMVFIKS